METFKKILKKLEKEDAKELPWPINKYGTLFFIFTLILLSIAIITYSIYLGPYGKAHLATGAAALGASLGALGSYFGSTEGSRRSYEFTKKQKTSEAARQLYFLLKLSIEMFDYNIREQGRLHTISTRKKAIYNEKWFEYLACLDTINKDEQELLFEWFLYVGALESGCGHNIKIEDKNVDGEASQDIASYCIVAKDGEKYWFKKEQYNNLKILLQKIENI